MRQSQIGTRPSDVYNIQHCSMCITAIGCWPGVSIELTLTPLPSFLHQPNFLRVPLGPDRLAHSISLHQHAPRSPCCTRESPCFQQRAALGIPSFPLRLQYASSGNRKIAYVLVRVVDEVLHRSTDSSRSIASLPVCAFLSRST